jgi:hypothetical protein
MDLTEMADIAKQAREARPPKAVRVGLLLYQWLKEQAAERPLTWGEVVPSIPLGIPVLIDPGLMPWDWEFEG